MLPVQVSALGLHDHGHSVDPQDSKPFVALYQYPVIKERLFSTFSHFLILLVMQPFHALFLLRKAFSAIIFDRNFKQAQQVIREGLRKEYQRKFFCNIAKEFSIFHFHDISPESIKAVEWVPDSAKVVLSVWGSDLFRVAGVENYRKQLKALERADVITSRSSEMKETLLAKFGREFSKKIRYAALGVPHTVLTDIDRYRTSQGRAEFVKKYNLLPHKKIVVISGSGRPDRQHPQIFDAITKLEKQVKDQIVLIVPITYDRSESYCLEVKEKLMAGDIETRLIENYLDNEALAQLRVFGDIMIHLPETDAFSAAMCETLYAENILITGSWLPYRSLKTAGVYYHEIEAVGELSEKLAEILNTYGHEKLKAKGNRTKIRPLIHWDGVIQGWRNVYEELISNKKAQGESK